MLSSFSSEDDVCSEFYYVVKIVFFVLLLF